MDGHLLRSDAADPRRLDVSRWCSGTNRSASFSLESQCSDVENHTFADLCKAHRQAAHTIEKQYDREQESLHTFIASVKPIKGKKRLKMLPVTDPLALPRRAARKALRLAREAVGFVPLFRSPPRQARVAPSMKAFARASAVVESLPDLIYVEMAMACNFGCKMCPVPESRKLMDGRVPSIMKPDTFSLVLQSIRDRPRHLWLTQLGEPMLNKHLTDYVKAAKSSGHHVGFTTNGSMMTETKARDLLLAGVDHVVFSFDGATKKTFEKIRIGGNFDEVVANIKGFAAMNGRLRSPENRCMVQVDMIVSDMTEPEVGDFHAMWKDVATLTQAIPIDDWAGQLDLPSDFGKPRTSRDEIKRYACD